MKPEISKEIEPYDGDDDDLEYGSVLRPRLKPPAPTTNRRGSRSQKQPLGPAYDDGHTDSGTGAEDSAENPSSAGVEQVLEIFRTDHAQDALANWLGDAATDADPEDLRRAVEQIEEEGVFILTLAVVPRGCPTRLCRGVVDSGAVLPVVTLAEGRDAEFHSDAAGRSVVIANDLGFVRALDETLTFIASEIEMIASENNLRIDLTRLKDALFGFAARFFPATG